MHKKQIFQLGILWHHQNVILVVNRHTNLGGLPSSLEAHQWSSILGSSLEQPTYLTSHPSVGMILLPNQTGFPDKGFFGAGK